MAVACRCDVLNQMTGEVARDYTRNHLDQTGATDQTTYQCPETGATWIEERAPESYGENLPRLRRLNRG